MKILPGDISGRDFVTAEHSGNNQWEYLCAVGKTDLYGALFLARVKMEVASGTIAYFKDIQVEVLGNLNLDKM